MDINNALFQTLLRQQKITEFRSFRIEPSSIDNSKLDNNIKIDYRYVNLNNIYAYIKEDIFHICNEKFEDLKITDFYFPEKGIHRIGYTDDEYIYPFTDNDNSIVINSEGRIVGSNPENFFYVGTNEFLEASPIFLHDYEDGLLYDFIKRQFIRPYSFDSWTGYKQNYDVKTPKIENINLIINGCQEKNFEYLFSVKKNNIKPPHTLSYFFNSENKSLFYFESSKYGTSKVEVTPVCLWYTNINVFAICIKILNEFDSEGNIISLDSSYSNKVSFEIKVNNGFTFGCDSTAILDFHGSLKNKYDLKYFYENLEFIPTKNSILILFSDDCRYSYHVIIVKDNGEITLCKHIECKGVALTENSILRLSNYERDSVDYCDIYGTRLCTAEGYSPKYQIFTRNLREPITFNPEETLVQRKDKMTRFYEDGVISQLEGVIDLQNGNVIVPPSYSKVQLRFFESGYDKILDKPVYVSIVQIDNYFKGVVNSYFGIYLNENLVTPVAYSNIQYLKYKCPRKDVYNERELNDDNNFKEYESIFVLLEKNGLYGVASKFGFTIIEPCASTYKILEETKHIPIKNEPGNVFLRNIPKGAPEYFSLCKNDSFNLIYRDKIVCDFVIDDFELISLEGYGDELFFVKAFSDSKEAIIYKGQFRTDFYNQVRVFHSKFGYPKDNDNDSFVVVVTDDLGNSSLLNCNSETIIQFGPHLITPFLNYVKIGSFIYDIDNIVIFDASDYSLVDEKHGCHNEHILCFHSENNEKEYVVINSEGEVHKLNIDDSDDEKFYVGLKSYYFDTNLLVFEEVPIYDSEDEDDYPYDDYTDDTDYERDTFYALGGDDYDEWKKNGGNLDDMMDGMGY